MSSFLILVVKYVGGSLDLLLAPLLIILLDKEVRLGVTLIYRSVLCYMRDIWWPNIELIIFPVYRLKRLKRSNTVSSCSMGL
jgi:hypothetical protein